MASAVAWPIRIVIGAVSLALLGALGSGRSAAGERDAAAAPPAAAVVTPSTGARRSVRGGMRCAACAADRPASAFSASQRKQTAARRRCIECVEGDRQPQTQPPQQSALPAAEPTPFAPAASFALAAGKDWPHAVTYRGVPPLYPAPALWVRDIPGFLATLPAPLRRPELRFILRAYQNQFELDERYALLQWAYDQLPGGAAAARPHAVHAELFDAAGLTLHVRNTGDVPATQLFASQGGYAVNTRVKVEAAAQRFCDKCKRPAAARCRCGEAYCSRECQMAHWRDHRKICEFIDKQFQIGIAYNEAFWAMRGVGKCQDRC